MHPLVHTRFIFQIQFYARNFGYSCRGTMKRGRQTPPLLRVRRALKGRRLYEKQQATGGKGGFLLTEIMLEEKDFFSSSSFLFSLLLFNIFLPVGEEIIRFFVFSPNFFLRFARAHTRECARKISFSVCECAKRI